MPITKEDVEVFREWLDAMEDHIADMLYEKKRAKEEEEGEYEQVEYEVVDISQKVRVKMRRVK